MDIENLKYPIGKYVCPETITEEQITLWINELEILPQQVDDITKNLTPEQLQKHYRPDGWTVTQVVNHLADSHLNAYVRVHLTLTEETPIIRPYFEDKWAELPDGLNQDISVSITILKGIHQRLVLLLRSLKSEDFNRQYIHPEVGTPFTLGYLLGNYAWHGKHHLAHIRITL